MGSTPVCCMLLPEGARGLGALTPVTTERRFLRCKMDTEQGMWWAGARDQLPQLPTAHPCTLNSER